MNNRKLKVKIGVVFYDTTLKTDIRYEQEYDVNCEHHADFQNFLKKLHDEGVILHMNKLYGNIHGDTIFKNPYYILESLYIHVPMSEEKFNEMLLKWEAIFKQYGLI